MTAVLRDGYNKILSSLISVFNATLPFLQLVVGLTFMQITPSFDEPNLTLNIPFRFEIRQACEENLVFC